MGYLCELERSKLTQAGPPCDTGVSSVLVTVSGINSHRELEASLCRASFLYPWLEKCTVLRKGETPPSQVSTGTSESGQSTIDTDAYRINLTLRELFLFLVATETTRTKASGC